MAVRWQADPQAGQRLRVGSFAVPRRMVGTRPATLSSVTAVRDSKDPAGPALTFTPAEWAAFTVGVRAGEFD